MTMMLLAQIPAEIKEPGFAQWVVYLIVLLYVIEKVSGGVMKLTGRELPAKREITGTVISQEPIKHAAQADLDELEKLVTELRQSNEAQHNAARIAGEHRVQSLSEVIDSETGKLEGQITALREAVMVKIEQGFADITKQLQPLTVDVAKHDTQLDDLVPRVTRIETKFSEATAKLHERINDLILKRKPS